MRNYSHLRRAATDNEKARNVDFRYVSLAMSASHVGFFISSDVAHYIIQLPTCQGPFFANGYKAVKESRSDISQPGEGQGRNTSSVQSSNFSVGSDSALDFADGSVDLVTSCQAAHWFDDIGAFYAEADRVLRPGGAIAVYGYHFTDPVGTDNAAVEEELVLHRVVETFNIFGTEFILKRNFEERMFTERFLRVILKRNIYNTCGAQERILRGHRARLRLSAQIGGRGVHNDSSVNL